MGIYRVKVRCSSGHNPGDIIDSDRPEFKDWDIAGMLARGHIEFAPKGATPTDAPVQLPAPDTTASVATATPEEQENPSTEAKPAKTNLNTASKTELKELPHIGDSSADAIITARNTRPLQTLDRVWEVLPHIKGEKRAELEPLIEL
ncbi:MAG: helix-hairpin-helix domain-containing protein [Cyanobacteria bacterium P01_E01_bin.42]